MAAEVREWLERAADDLREAEKDALLRQAIQAMRTRARSPQVMEAAR
ncbi:MAG TPA: hypothetical protein VFC93_01820 [Chloroflexota bacterium]|nr:hypothetical protein [Chloroflexota bacterium]